MANAKNKHSSRIHSRTRFISNYETPARKAILVIIVIAIFAVIVSLICSFTFNTERTIKSEISNLATGYYEDYLYKSISSSGKDINEVMQKYVDTGFSTIPLRQLILHSPQKSSLENTMLNYCDENATLIQFFPTEPFGKTDYRVEYTYSCSF